MWLCVFVGVLGSSVCIVSGRLSLIVCCMLCWLGRVKLCLVKVVFIVL